MKVKKKDIISIVLISMLFCTTYLLNNRYKKPILKVSKQDSAININQTILQIFSLGNQRFLSSLLWVQTLLESDIEDYKKKDLNSWMFIRFKSIINLDPYFYDAYKIGGQYLSVIKDDDLGAAKILKMGTEKFPNDFWLHYLLGFQYYFELDDIDSAIQIYEKIERHPLVYSQVRLLPGIISRLKASKGSLESAHDLILTTYNNLGKENTKLREKYYNNLYAIRAELDLNCLNSSKADCNKIDLDGNNYQIRNKKYYAIKNWTPFRAKKRGAQSPSN